MRVFFVIVKGGAGKRLLQIIWELVLIWAMAMVVNLLGCSVGIINPHAVEPLSTGFAVGWFNARYLWKPTKQIHREPVKPT